MQGKTVGKSKHTCIDLDKFVNLNCAAVTAMSKTLGDSYWSEQLCWIQIRDIINATWHYNFHLLKK